MRANFQSLRRFPLTHTALVLACVLQAHAELDIGRLAMGRTTYPAKSWAFDTFHDYTAARLNDPTADRMRSDFELERGETDRFGWEVALETTRANRDRLQLGHGAIGARYLAIEQPLQVALAAEYLPSLRKKPDEWEVEIEALKNIGPFSGVLQYSGEVNERRDLESTLILGPIYRFGLQGLAGPQWIYEGDGGHSLNLLVGGSISRRLFISFQPRIGLTRQAPDLKILLELHAFFGPYALGGWGLQ